MGKKTIKKLSPRDPKLEGSDVTQGRHAGMSREV